MVTEKEYFSFESFPSPSLSFRSKTAAIYTKVKGLLGKTHIKKSVFLVVGPLRPPPRPLSKKPLFFL